MFRTITLLAALCMSTQAFAQESDSVKYIRLDFVAKETEGGKVINSRSYLAQTSTARDSRSASIRSGSRVPTLSGGKYTYYDLGANIDCDHAKVEDGQLSIHVTADVSGVLQEAGLTPSSGPAAPPVIRQNKWSGDVLVPFRKPTIIFSSDDLTTKRQLQLELTATQIK